MSVATLDSRQTGFSFDPLPASTIRGKDLRRYFRNIVPGANTQGFIETFRARGVPTIVAYTFFEVAATDGAVPFFLKAINAGAEDSNYPVELCTDADIRKSGESEFGIPEGRRLSNFINDVKANSVEAELTYLTERVGRKAVMGIIARGLSMSEDQATQMMEILR